MGQGLCLRSWSGEGKCVYGMAAIVVPSYMLAASRVTLYCLSPHAKRPHLFSSISCHEGVGIQMWLFSVRAEVAQCECVPCCCKVCETSLPQLFGSLVFGYTHQTTGT